MFTKIKHALDLLKPSYCCVDNVEALLTISRQNAAQTIHGWTPQRKAGHGEDFWQFRPYESGDDPKHIYWRQSAKGDDIQIRQQEHLKAPHNLLWRSYDEGMQFRSSGALYSKQDAANIIALSLAMLLKKAEEPFRYAGHKEQQSTPALADLLLQNKTAISALHETSTPSKSRPFIISDFLNEFSQLKEILKPISNLCSYGILIQVLDPAELDFPYSGRWVFKESKKIQSIDIQKAQSIQSHYQAEINRHINDLKTWCHNHGWIYALHRTDQSIAQTLQNIWQDNIKRKATQ